MNQLFFWNTWQKPYRNLYLVLLSLISICIAIGAYYRIMGYSANIDWNTYLTIQTLPVVIDNFGKGLINYAIESEGFMVYQQYYGSEIKLNTWAIYGFLGIIVFSFSVFMGAISSVRNNWYYLYATLAIAMLFGFKLELLEVFAQKNNYIFIAAILFYIIPSYILVAFKRHYSMLTNIAIFTGISIVFFSVVIANATVQAPAIQLVQNGILVPVAITCILIVAVAYDNIHVFLYLITANNSVSAQGNALNFIVVSLIYFTNITLVYLKISHTIDFNIIYVDIFLIFALAVIAGIWGTRKRNVFMGTLPYEPIGAVVYLCAALVAVATITFQLATANQTFVLFFENLITYTQLCFGLLFFFYVLTNFFVFLYKNQKVHLIVYKPDRLPLAMVPALGAVFVGALFMKSNLTTIDQGVSGYYNGLADAYMKSKDYFVAEQFYKKANSAYFYNFKGNYTLGVMARSLGDNVAATYYFSRANNNLYSNEYAYVNWANSLEGSNNLFDAFDVLKEAKTKYPKSGKVYNNLGILFKRTNINDSTLYYFKLARQLNDDETVPMSNLLAFGIEKTQGNVNAEMIDTTESQSNNKAYETNKLFIYNRLGVKYNGNLKPDTSSKGLPYEDFAYFYNYELNRIKEADTTMLAYVKAYTKKDTTSEYYDNLSFLKAAKHYYAGNKNLGIAEMYSLVSTAGQSAPILANTLGMWMMKENAYGLAADFFKTSLNKRNENARLNYALALTENGDFAQAFDEWSIVRTSKDKDDYNFASTIQPLIYVAVPEQAMTWDDENKTHYLHFRHPYMKLEELIEIYNSIKNPTFKQYATLELFKKQYTAGNYQAIVNVYPQALSLGTVPTSLLEELNEFYCKSLIKLNKKDIAKDIIAKSKIDPAKKYYFDAMINATNGNTKEANKLYSLAVNNNPFDTDANIDAANYFNSQNKKQDAYGILVNAVSNNPKDVRLYKAYCLQALKVGLDKFANDALNAIQSYVPAYEYEEFKVEYDKVAKENGL
ncbi:MAG: hypothetical protein RLZZ175_1171 [Bacteroidota bacterium]|jgi:thioredoxin-like negative regulator of GroEL